MDIWIYNKIELSNETNFSNLIPSNLKQGKESFPNLYKSIVSNHVLILGHYRFIDLAQYFQTLFS